MKFFVSSLVLTYVYAHKSAPKGVLEGVLKSAPAAPTGDPKGASKEIPAGAPSSAPAPAGTVKIGFVSPQTGPLAPFGESDKFVIDYMTEYFAKNPLQIGGQPYNVEIIVKDAESDSAKAGKAAADLINNDGVDIVIACPGRLEDLIQQRHCQLDRVEVSVLDEADHMADLGFLPGVKRLLDKVPTDAQHLLFSATLDGDSDTAAGATVTVNTDDVVDVPPSEFVTVTLRAPTVAFDATATGTVRCVASTNVVLPTVRPVPEIDTVASLSKPVPVTVTVACTAP